jgi:hypothetical protein
MLGIETLIWIVGTLNSYLASRRNFQLYGITISARPAALELLSAPVPREGTSV